MQDQNYYRVFDPSNGVLLFDFFGGLVDLMAKVYAHADRANNNVVSIVKHERTMSLLCEFGGSNNED